MVHAHLPAQRNLNQNTFEIMYTHTKIFNDHIKFYRHFCFCFLKAFNKGHGVYTSLIIAIFDIWFNAGHLVCNALRSEFYYFSTKLYQWFCYACTHAPAVYRYIGLGSLIYHSTHNAFFLLLRFVNLTRLDLKENVFFFFYKLRYNYWMFTTLN